MRVLIDLVVNHTSDQHPWFQEARRDRESKYHDWYVWADRKPARADDGVVFPGVQKSTWTYDKLARRWYFHRFYDFQPDLNTSHPMVQAEILKIMGFWTQLGVSGFRMDAVPFVIARKGADVKGAPEQYDMLRQFRELMQWRKGDAVILGEANVLPKTDMQYFGDEGERLHMMFNFQVNQNLFYALASADSRPLAKALAATRPRPATSQWGMFLRNHDELDLGRLTRAQRERVFAAFAPDKDMQLYDRGIRRRLAPMLGSDRRRLELAYSLMLTLPGTPVLRYGDEIGMGDDLSLPERNCARTPMQWSTEPHGGFTSARKPVRPVISGGAYGFEHVNVAAQRRDPDSLMNWMERACACARRSRRWGGATSRCSRIRRRAGAGAALRLAQQLGAVRAQPVGAAAGVRTAGAHRRARGRAAHQPADRGPQRGRQKGPALHAAGALRVPLVPGRRVGLPAQAQRDLSSRAGAAARSARLPRRAAHHVGLSRSRRRR
jgi:maltose alpha-D-glucosyltransferase/alpha-amylase